MIVSFHGGFLSLDQKVSIDVELISMITRLPLAGVDPTPFFVGKEHDTLFTNNLKQKYDLTRYTRGFSIANINDYIVQFATKVLFSKLLWKMRPNQFTARMIIVTKLCAASVQLNWSQYLLNELLADAEEAQEKGNTFHYSWLLILILFVAWEEPLNYQGVDIPI